MNLFSQKDPRYDKQFLGESTLRVYGYGCFLCSVATLFQIDPEILLQKKTAFTNEGLLLPEVLAEECGGSYIGSSNSPIDGWTIARTDHYAALGFPTHFFCVNHQTNQMIDPLKFPAAIEPLAYSILEYRNFRGTRLDFSSKPSVALLSNALRWATGLRKALIERTLKRLSKANQ